MPGEILLLLKNEKSQHLNEKQLEQLLDENTRRQWRVLRESLRGGEWFSLAMETKPFPHEYVDWRITYNAEQAARGMADDPACAIADMYLDAALKDLLVGVSDEELARQYPDQEIFRERHYQGPEADPIEDPFILDRFIFAVESKCPRCGHVERVEMPSQVGDLQLMATMIKLVAACPKCYVADSGDIESTESDSVLAQQEQEDFAHDGALENWEAGDLVVEE